MPLRTNICTDLTPPLFLCGVLAVATRGDDTFCCTPLFDRGRKCTLNLYFFSLCVLCLKGKKRRAHASVRNPNTFSLILSLFPIYHQKKSSSFPLPPASYWGKDASFPSSYPSSRLRGLTRRSTLAAATTKAEEEDGGRRTEATHPPFPQFCEGENCMCGGAAAGWKRERGGGRGRGGERERRT